MLRTIAISLVLLLSVGIMLPFTNSAHGIRQSAQGHAEEIETLSLTRMVATLSRAHASNDARGRSWPVATHDGCAAEHRDAREHFAFVGLAGPASPSLPAKARRCRSTIYRQ